MKAPFSTEQRIYAFDSQCFELAKYFCPHVSHHLVNELAQAIQDTVEDHPASVAEMEYLGT